MLGKNMNTVTAERKAICLRHRVAIRIVGKQMKGGRTIHHQLFCIHAGKSRDKEYQANKPVCESAGDVEALDAKLSQGWGYAAIVPQLWVCLFRLLHTVHS